jgi:hypothetical protein
MYTYVHVSSASCRPWRFAVSRPEPCRWPADGLRACRRRRRLHRDGRRDAADPSDADLRLVRDAEPLAHGALCFFHAVVRRESGQAVWRRGMGEAGGSTTRPRGDVETSWSAEGRRGEPTRLLIAGNLPRFGGWHLFLPFSARFVPARAGFVTFSIFHVRFWGSAPAFSSGASCAHTARRAPTD